MTHSLEPSGHFSSSSSAPSPAWRWRLEDSAGAEISPAGVSSPEFGSQSDAESWVGEAWRELLDAGVDAVTLFEGDREVYGPMSLHAS
jgi:hypothetical protein